MKLVTIRNSRMLAGVASMLECLGYDTEDRTIALGMEAPYLFIRREDGFIAGTALFRPQWINLYLHSIGFHLEQTKLPKEEVPAFLRQCPTAMLPMQNSKNDSHLQPAVFTGLNRGRFCFGTLSPHNAHLYSFTAAQLLPRLAASSTVYTLKAVPPEQADFIPYLGESLQNLDVFWSDFQKLLNTTVTRCEYEALQRSHLRALMHDLLPAASLTKDAELIEELKIALYFYEGIFQEQSPERILLRNQLPAFFIQNCVNWLKEDIIDRLYELGASDELVDSYRHIPLSD